MRDFIPLKIKFFLLVLMSTMLVSINVFSTLKYCKPWNYATKPREVNSNISLSQYTSNIEMSSFYSPAYSTENKKHTLLDEAVPRNSTATCDEVTLSPDDPTRLIDLTNFHFVQATAPCITSQESPISLLVLVQSAPRHYIQRDTIRHTWGSHLRNHEGAAVVRVLFVIGVADNQHALDSEYTRYGDLIQGNYLDTYNNLTYKHVMSLKWVIYNCPQAQHVLKVDDDVYVNMADLLLTLPIFPKEGLVLGHVVHNEPVRRKVGDKFYVSKEEYPDLTYPTYCYGWAVIYSVDVVRRLYVEAQKGGFFKFEDVYVTGIVAARAGVKSHVQGDPWMAFSKENTIDILMNGWPDKPQFILGPVNVDVNIMIKLHNLLLRKNSKMEEKVIS